MASHTSDRRVDSGTLRRAFAHAPSSIVAVCADTGIERIGMAASTFLPVSLEPPLVAFCVQNTSTTWPRLAQRSSLGISVLSAEHHPIVRVLAAKDGDRFTGVTTETHSSGALFVVGSALWLDVTLEEQIPAGDHVIALLRVNDLHLPDGLDTAVEPIVFHRSALRRLAAT
jgi:flavin reductase (DIM6/NTAB) family NADH-FMN oxidoreductase RutF